MSKASEKSAEREESLAYLRKLGIQSGSKIYTTVTHVAKSGMSRWIALYVVHEGEIENITWHVGRILGIRESNDRSQRSLVVGGCGMDMCFHTVYNLGRAMFPTGGPAWRGRNSDVKPGGHEPDGGYLLRPESL